MEPVLTLCKLAKTVRGYRGHARLRRAFIEGVPGCRGLVRVGMRCFFPEDVCGLAVHMMRSRRGLWSLHGGMAQIRARCAWRAGLPAEAGPGAGLSLERGHGRRHGALRSLFSLSCGVQTRVSLLMHSATAMLLTMR